MATTFISANSNAISQGFSNFKRVWGNRRLEDNWRRSQPGKQRYYPKHILQPYNKW
jgi:hypothetical protein